MPPGASGGAILAPMTNGTRTLEEESKAEAHDGFDLSQLWLLPLLLLAQVLAVFAGHADKLKAMRRRVRAMPEAWTDFIPGLLTAEWHIRSLTASGVEILMSGQELDIRDLVLTEDMPSGYQLPIPASAWEAHRRMEAIARFHADPETFIRRQAQRLAKRIAAAKAGSVHPVASETAAAAAAAVFSASGSGRPDPCAPTLVHTPSLGIRAPPDRSPYPKIHDSALLSRLRKREPVPATPHPEKSRYFKHSALWKNPFSVCGAMQKCARKRPPNPRGASRPSLTSFS